MVNYSIRYISYSVGPKTAQGGLGSAFSQHTSSDPPFHTAAPPHTGNACFHVTLPAPVPVPPPPPLPFSFVLLFLQFAISISVDTVT